MRFLNFIGGAIGILAGVIGVCAAIGSVILFGIFFVMLGPISLVLMLMLYMLWRFRPRSKRRITDEERRYWDDVATANVLGERARWDERAEARRLANRPNALD